MPEQLEADGLGNSQLRIDYSKLPPGGEGSNTSMTGTAFSNDLVSGKAPPAGTPTGSACGNDHSRREKALQSWPGSEAGRCTIGQ
jgi:hypothetical protein